ncbi:MAG: histidine kinase [Bacteroidales bacterium]|nr:histidine kinase [Bacteroidales bacterium]
MAKKFTIYNYALAYPVIIALVAGLIIILLMPPIFEKYKIEVVDHQNIFYDNHIHYQDINNDGYSERISISAVNNDYSYVNFYNEKKAISNVWNIHGKVNSKSLAFADYNDDGKQEVYLLSLFQDSLYLNCYAISEKHQGVSRSVFITTIPKHYEKPDYDVSPIIHKDINGNDYLESVFSVYGKYSMRPRRLYCYNWKNNSILQSPPSGVILQNVKAASDADEQSIYFSGNNAITNYYSGNDTIPYPDSKAWLMVFNNRMEYAFDPVPFENQGTMLKVLPIRYETQPHLIVLEKNLFDNHKTALYCYNMQGERVTEKKEYDKENHYINVFKPSQLAENQFYLVSEKGNIQLIDHLLNTIKKYDIGTTKNSSFHTLNIDDDDHEEIIQWSFNNHQLAFYQPGFSDFASINLPELQGSQVTISKKIAPNEVQISIKDYNHWYLINYSKSGTYFLKYLLFAVIIVFIYLVAYAIQKTIVIHSLEQERTMSRLKLTTLKNQIDPHFTLNALNAIGLSILKDQKEASYNNLQRFSQLIRNTLMEADSVTRTLEDEVQFVKDYIAIMQIRYHDSFDYHFQIDDKVDMLIKVPKMIIQSFVENAINHGLRPKKESGNLSVIFRKKGEGVENTHRG